MRNHIFSIFMGALLFNLCASFFSKPVYSAKKFRSKFISFNLPPNWDCKKEDLDWVCQPDSVAERSEVILIVVTKRKDPVDDTYEKYESVLNSSKRMKDLLGNSYNSVVKYVKSKDIRGQLWMDSLQNGSEIPGFYTRYLASFKEKVAGLVTYSIAESIYAKWADIMDQVVTSLEIKYDEKAFQEVMKNRRNVPLLGRRGRAGGGRGAPSLGGDTGEKTPEEKSDESPVGTIAGVLILAGAGFYYWKKKRGG